MDPKLVLIGGNFARKTVELPRPLKRLISICTDCLMIPLALWTAISLKAGRPVFDWKEWPAFVAVILVSLPIFIRAGLYRAVIRFLGHQAVFAVALAIAVSAIILGIAGEVSKVASLALERRGDLFLRRTVVCCRVALCGPLLPAAALYSCRLLPVSRSTAQVKPAPILSNRAVDHPCISPGAVHR